MTELLNPAIVYFLAAAAVWIHRARRAAKTLALVPRVNAGLSSPKSLIGDPTSLDSPVKPGNDTVTVILPAKNEEKNIAACLDSLIAQDYPNLEIIAVNDGSTDRTAEILEKKLSSPKSLIGDPTSLDSPVKPGNDTRALTILHAPPTPSGWTGKNFAIHSAFPAARGDWLLFTDADTRHAPQSVRAAVTFAEERGLAFLSLLPRSLAGSFWERMIQPAAMAFLGLWFPIDETNRPDSPAHFANGQYLLIRRDLYGKIGGHEKVKGEFLEDFALMKNAKAAGAPTACVFGTEIYGTRMYDSLAGIWRGWRRIYLAAFKRNPWQLAARALSLIIFTALPFFVFPSAWALSLPVLGLILVTAWKAFGLVKAQRAYVIFLPITALVLAAILLDAARLAAAGKSTKWR